MVLETRFFLRTFRRGANQALETAEIIEVASEADAMGALERPGLRDAGAIALALHIADEVEITLLHRRGEIPDGIARLYGGAGDILEHHCFREAAL